MSSDAPVSLSVTDGWLAASPVPPLDGPAGLAERLVLLAHYGADFDVWGGSRRARYWDALAERVRAATYAGATLMHWWGSMCELLPTAPRNAAERSETGLLLACGQDRQVLAALRDHAPALVLRARLVSEARRPQEDR